MSKIDSALTVITGTVTTISGDPKPTSQWLFQIMGAVLAIGGGFFAVIFRLRIERKAEINHIKISIIDELNDICEIIKKMKDTYDATTPHVISNTYLTDLSQNTESFTFHKVKFYLISNTELRKEIHAFYKNLDKKVTESINTVGTLGTTTVNHDIQIVNSFVAIATHGAELKNKISKYKYRVLWFN